MRNDAVHQYATAQVSTLHGRTLEARALLEAAQRLQGCLDGWDQPDHDARLQDAVLFTQRLWTVFQAEWLTDPSPLPDELRGNLLLLSEYVDRTLFTLQAAPEAALLPPLIDIHRQLASGLTETPEETHPSTPEPPARGADHRVIKQLQGEDGYDVFSDGAGPDAAQRLRRDYEDSRW